MTCINQLLRLIRLSKITDRSILFQTIELLDKYYQSCGEPQPKSDLWLSLVTCFFMI